MEKSQKILLLGNPRLYEVSTEVRENERDGLPEIASALHNALMDFRGKYGRGRAIAAPQIGIMKRIIYMHIDSPVVLVNPVFTWKNPEMIELWDDCMSFPDLLVKVRRHKSCRLAFRDESWKLHEWELEGDLSELLQHEYDHLDGIVAVMRAIDGKSFAMASQKELVGFVR